MSLLKELLKARVRYFGKYNAYPARLLLQSSEIETELLNEYRTMKIRKGSSDEIAGTPYVVDETLTTKFEFRGNRPRWDDDD